MMTQASAQTCAVDVKTQELALFRQAALGRLMETLRADASGWKKPLLEYVGYRLSMGAEPAEAGRTRELRDAAVKAYSSGQGEDIAKEPLLMIKGLEELRSQMINSWRQTFGPENAAEQKRRQPKNKSANRKAQRKD